MITLEKSVGNKIDNCISCDNRLHEISLVVGSQKIRLCNDCLREFILSTDIYKQFRQEIIDNYEFKFRNVRDKFIEDLEWESIKLRKIIIELIGKEGLKQYGYKSPEVFDYESGKYYDSYEGE